MPSRSISQPGPPDHPALVAIRSLGAGHLGPISLGAWGYRHLYVAIDKFTKWAEVEAVHTIPAGSAVKFIKGLVSRFGVPNHIITDNDSQFTSNLFKTYCANLGTQICYIQWRTPEATARTSRQTRRS